MESSHEARAASASAEPGARRRNSSVEFQGYPAAEEGQNVPLAGAPYSSAPLPTPPVAADAADAAASIPRARLLSATARLRSLSGSRERPRHERDSLRNRSQEGRPGTRRHKRHEHSRLLIHSLRNAMAKCGEGGAAALSWTEEELLSHASQMRPEHRPSAFYRLMEFEGADNALDAWEAAESYRARPRSRERVQKKKDANAEAELAVRREFSDTMAFLKSSGASRELLAKLEACAVEAFKTLEGRKEAESWQLSWDHEEQLLDTTSGAPPALEMEVLGLSPMDRKVVHQLAKVLGLHSESRQLQGALAEVAEGDGKAVALRPTRRQCAEKSSWTPRFSVSKVLAVNC
eukprot:TRINITY_DN111532_c0_g1_i1.p1 TRINITY_DN111532_c0_g1~~TRINITY_DN111532_c0_g1_i1.p1  ORF type:complete len:348 (-),score=78.62 TRINITY_DN111532_c0_g1_i1:65-1108(-)